MLKALFLALLSQSAVASSYIPSVPGLPEPKAQLAASPVKLKAEYRCDVEWQLAPGVIDPKTGKNHKMIPYSFVEFAEPVVIDGLKVYGTGNELEEIDRNWEGTKFVLLKKEAGPAFIFGMLLSGTTLATSPELRQSLKGLHGKERLGKITLSAGGSIVFQRAPIQFDLAPGALRPLGGRCEVRATEAEGDLNDPRLGYLQKPWN